MAVPLAQPLAPLFGSVALIAGLVLITRRRAGALIGAGAVQAWAAAGVAAVRGGLGGDAGLVAAALITMAANGVAIPIALTLITRRRDAAPVSAPGGMGLGAVLVGLAALAVPGVAVAGGALTRESLAVAIAVGLLGALMLAGQRSPLAQLAGVLSLGNGLILAATPGVPLIAMGPLVALAPAALLLGAMGLGAVDLDAGATPGSPGP